MSGITRSYLERILPMLLILVNAMAKKHPAVSDEDSGNGPPPTNHVRVDYVHFSAEQDDDEKTRIKGTFSVKLSNAVIWAILSAIGATIAGLVAHLMQQ